MKNKKISNGRSENNYQTRDGIFNWVPIIISIIALIVSIQSCRQSTYSNQISKESNDISRDANRSAYEAVNIAKNSLDIEVESLKETKTKNTCDEADKLLDIAKSTLSDNKVIENASRLRLNGNCKEVINMIHNLSEFEVGYEAEAIEEGIMRFSERRVIGFGLSHPLPIRFGLVTLVIIIIVYLILSKDKNDKNH